MKNIRTAFQARRFTYAVLLWALFDVFIGGHNGGLVPLTPLAAAQATLTQTTTTAALDNQSQFVAINSATSFTAGNQAFVDREALDILAVDATAKVLTVRRGAQGTVGRAHISGATVSTGPGNYFMQSDPSGACTSTAQVVLPTIAIPSGRQWNCINGQWMVDGGILPFSWSDCQSSVSGNASGTNGYTTAGASLLPVVQASTSATGTNTHSYVCKVQIESLLQNRGVAIVDVVFYYGVQTTALGTQAAVLASGTFNGSTVFGTLTYPAVGASETASTVAPARADLGTMVITPPAASANTATTTAGAFYSQKFAPASALALSTDLQDLVLTFTLQCTATSATVTNSPGGVIHYAYIPG